MHQLQKTAGMANHPHRIALAILALVAEQKWFENSLSGFSVRDLYSCLQVGSWMDLGADVQRRVVMELLDELVAPNGGYEVAAFVDRGDVILKPV